MHRLISLPPLVKISRLLHWLKGPRRTPPVCRVPALEKAELAASDREQGLQPVTRASALRRWFVTSSICDSVVQAARHPEDP